MNVRKNYVDVEVYYSIAVAKYTKNYPEQPNLKPFILLQFTTLNVNEVALVVTAVVCMLMKLRHLIV